MERKGNVSTNLSDHKARNDKYHHETISSNGDAVIGIGSQSHRGATSISKEIRKQSNALRFNTQNPNGDSSMQPCYAKRMQDYGKDHETASANISGKKMNAFNREALS